MTTIDSSQQLTVAQFFSPRKTKPSEQMTSATISTRTTADHVTASCGDAGGMIQSTECSMEALADVDPVEHSQESVSSTVSSTPSWVADRLVAQPLTSYRTTVDGWNALLRLQEVSTPKTGSRFYYPAHGIKTSKVRNNNVSTCDTNTYGADYYRRQVCEWLADRLEE